MRVPLKTYSLGLVLGIDLEHLCRQAMLKCQNRNSVGIPHNYQQIIKTWRQPLEQRYIASLKRQVMIYIQQSI